MASTAAPKPNEEQIAELRGQFDQVAFDVARDHQERIEALEAECKTYREAIGHLQRQLASLCDELVIIRLPTSPKKSRLSRWFAV